MMGELKFLPQYQNVVVTPRARDYLVAGKRYQRVTTALGVINKPALIPWAKRVTLENVAATLLNPTVKSELLLSLEESPGGYEAFVERLITRAGKASGEERDQKAGRGTDLHQAIQDSFQATNLDDSLSLLDKDSTLAVRAAHTFLQAYGIAPCASELVVWNEDLQIAGTIDGVGWCGGKLVIWDWKTGAHLYWETALQLAAYAICLSVLTGVEVDAAYAVRLPSPPACALDYEVKKLDRLGFGSAWLAYRQALGLYRAQSKELWVEEGNE